MFKRKGAGELREFLKKIYEEKVKAISNNIYKFEEEKIEKTEKEYLKIIDKWEKEYNEATSKLEKVPKALREEKNLFTPEFATCNFKKNLKKSQNIGIFLLTFFTFCVIILVGG